MTPDAIEKDILINAPAETVYRVITEPALRDYVAGQPGHTGYAGRPRHGPRRPGHGRGRRSSSGALTTPRSVRPGTWATTWAASRGRCHDVFGRE